MDKRINEIKKENRKALKKFVLNMCICAILGGLAAGILSNSEEFIKDIPKYFNSFFISILPYSICILGAIFLYYVLCYIRKAENFTRGMMKKMRN